MGCSGTKVKKENYIIAEFYIDEEDINSEIHILNCVENLIREKRPEDRSEDEKNHLQEFKNENDLTKCSIRINDALIPFCYRYKFQAPGNYIIEYTFPIKLTQTSYMFFNCNCMKKVDLSNLDTSNLTKLRGMFQECSNLESIIFFNSLNQKVINMDCFFIFCEKLKNISLSNSNKDISISFDYLFCNCSALETVDLSNFEAKLIKATSMFSDCNNLKKVDLSGLVSTNESKLEGMFHGFTDKNKLITKDKNILKEFEEQNDGEEGLEEGVAEEGEDLYEEEGQEGEEWGEEAAS